MVDQRWATATATQQVRAIRRGRITSRELLELYLERLTRLNTSVNAVVTVVADQARAEADAADALMRSGAPLPALHGLPITVKDALETAGIRSTGGAAELADHVPDRDATAVQRLREAGAIVFGKTNVPRWSGDAQCYNDIFGTTNNPWDLARVPGGSSGGSAAAVAAGLSSVDVGTDIAGSIRIPAHFCGVFGLRPSTGVIPQDGYLDSVGGGTTDIDLNTVGPIARSALDLELLLHVLAGPRPAEQEAWRLRLPPPTFSSLAGRRLAVWLDDPAMPGDTSMLAVLARAVDRVGRAGAHIEHFAPPVDPQQQFDVFMRLVTAATALSKQDSNAESRASHRLWLRANRERAAIQTAWSAKLSGYDALLAPVVCTTAFRHVQDPDMSARRLNVGNESRPYISVTWWTGMFGVLGVPVVAVPVGRTEQGLPVGLQVVAPYLRDRDAVRTAHLIAELDGGYEAPPGFS